AGAVRRARRAALRARARARADVVRTTPFLDALPRPRERECRQDREQEIPGRAVTGSARKDQGRDRVVADHEEGEPDEMEGCDEEADDREGVQRDHECRLDGLPGETRRSAPALV